mgnify:CR=1 FL=1
MTGSGELFVGVMSGTSADGIDAVLADFSSPRPRFVHGVSSDYPDAIRKAALTLNAPGADELDRAAKLAVALADLYAAAVIDLLRQAGVPTANVRAIGCHGQTVRHRPDAGFTIQLVNGAQLAERCGIDVVTDFRSRDVAAGGQGAPLVPAFHEAMFRHPTTHRAVVNIGGIANITDLPPANVDDQVRGFDTGPGNCLLDLWAARHTGARFDQDGHLAAIGRIDADLLARMLAEPYFSMRPPKSTGRDLFDEQWIARHLTPRLAAADVQSTLVELTAKTIADAIRTACRDAREVFVCGGGVHNPVLMSRLAASLPTATVTSTAVAGVDPRWVEAYAFAWLARRTVRREPGNIAAVTGAAGPRILGALYAK